MRSFLAGLLLLLAPSLASAQASGFVESIGFENNYRPDCWTSMVINLTPQTEQSGTYQIQVRQEDLDRDRAIFTRTITLTGAGEGGGAKQQKFRMYFIPQPTDGGLPTARDGTLKELQDRLKVSLHSESGKWICDLPVTAMVMSADPWVGTYDNRRGSKLILAVSNGSSRAAYLDRTTGSALLGVMEDVVIISVQPRDLPESVLGYDAVDAVIWFNADPAELRSGGNERFAALESYIRRGGSLVISQSADWQKTAAFGELMPVTVTEMRDKSDLSPLKDIAQQQRSSVQPVPGEPSPWERLRGPFRVAFAKARPEALVDHWITWDAAGKEFSPYIARIPVGLGSVTWVAQDLGDTAITSRAKPGWPAVWDAVFDWKNNPLAVTSTTEDALVAPYQPAAAMDVGFSLLQGMDLHSKTVWLLTLAIVFFIAYWLLAGPGIFAYLVGRRRTQLSWFLFAASAVAATLLTVLIVQLVLRGPPELRHFSIVRKAPGEPAVVRSRFGLYIPRDGYQNIELKNTAANQVSTISALAWNPSYPPEAPDMQGPEYTLPVREPTSTDAPAVRVPYSSTLKKFQATWTGDLSGGIEGSASIVEDGWIRGNLTNGTGLKLKNVYIAFKYPTNSVRWDDMMLFIPSWDVGVTIDLNREYNLLDDGSRVPLVPDAAKPEEGGKVRGNIALDWSRYWLDPMRGTTLVGDGKRDDFNDKVRRSLPMMSLFDRLPPVKNTAGKNDRFELLRRGGRHLDLSGALAAGALVVLAEADAPAKLPFPLEVQGDPVDGAGAIFYQTVLPLDRSRHPASTQPAWDVEQ